MEKKSRIFNAVRNTVFTFAILHLLLLAISMVQKGNIASANVFTIIDLDLFVPGVAGGGMPLLLSYALVLLIYAFYYKKTEK